MEDVSADVCSLLPRTLKKLFSFAKKNSNAIPGPPETDPIDCYFNAAPVCGVRIGTWLIRTRMFLNLDDQFPDDFLETTHKSRTSQETFVVIFQGRSENFSIAEQN